MPYLPHTSPDHDETLIARLAAADLPENDRDGRLARSQVADCPACAELLTDLRAIASATAELPAPRRTHDFRLTEADAARLRPAGWRGVLARIGSPSFAFTRPLATGLATLGIAGLILASLPAGLGPSAASAPEAGGLNAVGSSAGAQDTSGSYAAGAPSAAPSSAPAPAFEGPVVSPDRAAASASAPPEAASSPAGGGLTGNGGAKNGATPGTAAGPTAPAAGSSGTAAIGERETAGAGGPSLLVAVSVVLLVAGLALGALRLVARRVV